MITKKTRRSDDQSRSLIIFLFLHRRRERARARRGGGGERGRFVPPFLPPTQKIMHTPRCNTAWMRQNEKTHRERGREEKRARERAGRPGAHTPQQAASREGVLFWLGGRGALLCCFVDGGKGCSYFCVNAVPAHRDIRMCVCPSRLATHMAPVPSFFFFHR